MSAPTAHHEAGHAVAAEALGLPWEVTQPDNHVAAATAILAPAEPIPGFTLSDAVLIALAGWSAECHHRGTWDDPYVREGAEEDFVILTELSSAEHSGHFARARTFVEVHWLRIEEVAAEILDEFG